MGCKVQVEGILPDENVTVAVPAGTQYGEMVKTPEFGMPRSGGGGSRGALYARVLIAVPKKLNREAREALEKYARVMGDDFDAPRSVGDRIRDAIDDIID